MIDNRPLFPGIRAREIFVLGLGIVDYVSGIKVYTRWTVYM